MSYVVCYLEQTWKEMWQFERALIIVLEMNVYYLFFFNTDIKDFPKTNFQLLNLQNKKNYYW